MRVSCPTCSKPYLVPDAKIPVQGARIRCKQCGDRFIVKPFPAGFNSRDFRDIGLVWTLKRADGSSLEIHSYDAFEALEQEGLLSGADTLTFDNEAFPTLKQLADVRSWMWEIWRRVEEHKIHLPTREEEETGDSPTFNGLFRGNREQAFTEAAVDETSASLDEPTPPSAVSEPPAPPAVSIEGPTNAELGSKPKPKPKPASPTPRVAPQVKPAASSPHDPLGLLSSLGRPAQKGTPRVRPSPASRQQDSDPTPSSDSRQPPPVAGIRTPSRNPGPGRSQAAAEPQLDDDPKTEEATFELPPMPANAESTGISPFKLFGALVAALAAVLFPLSILILGVLG